jgi:hypothetical protein
MLITVNVATSKHICRVQLLLDGSQYVYANGGHLALVPSLTYFPHTVMVGN